MTPVEKGDVRNYFSIRDLNGRCLDAVLSLPDATGLSSTKLEQA